MCHCATLEQHFPSELRAMYFSAKDHNRNKRLKIHLTNLSQVSVNTFAGVGLSVVRVHLLLCIIKVIMRFNVGEGCAEPEYRGDEQALTEYFTPSHSKKEAIKGLSCPL